MATYERIAWVDAARGLCILLVVTMHSTLGVGLAMGGEGWLHAAVAFAEPFRIPAFFMVAGLFADRVMGWPWRRFFDRRVLHYAYFYVLWVTIQFAFKAPAIAAEEGVTVAVESYLLAFVQPFGTLWFIFVLPIFYLLVRVTRDQPGIAVFIIALAAHLMPIHTGWLVADELADRFVFFFAGYLFRDQIFALAAAIGRHWLAGMVLLAIWAGGHLALQSLSFPGLRTGLAIAGSCAVVACAALAAQLPSNPMTSGLNWVGRHSIVIYLAFFLPMAVTRVLIVKTGLVEDVGLASLITTMAAIAGPITLYWMTHVTGFGRFLFERPRFAIYERRARDRVPAATPAE